MIKCNKQTDSAIYRVAFATENGCTKWLESMKSGSGLLWSYKRQYVIIITCFPENLPLFLEIKCAFSNGLTSPINLSKHYDRGKLMGSITKFITIIIHPLTFQNCHNHIFSKFTLEYELDSQEMKIHLVFLLRLVPLVHNGCFRNVQFAVLNTLYFTSRKPR